MRFFRLAWPLLLLAPACGDDAVSPNDAGSFPFDASRPRTDAGDAGGGSDATISDGAADAPLDGPRTDGGGDGGPSAPVIDGVINPGEYGTHTDGQNQQTSDVDAATRPVWYLTWDDTNLYVGVSSSNVAEGVVIYIDVDPLAQLNGGTNANGSLTGFGYDTVVATVPIRADFVAYSKSTYNEYRRADGAGGWASQTQAALTQVGTGTTRELLIPWLAVRTGGRPASFAWTGYAVSNSSQYVYAEMPPDNPGGAVGAAVAFPWAYKVDNATPLTGTKPFANKVMP